MRSLGVQAVGYVGVVAFAIAWIPQSLETVRAGFCRVNRGFLWLTALGSASLAAYAFLEHDHVFSLLNTLTTAGALLNVYYREFPRPPSGPPRKSGSSNEKREPSPGALTT
jgi:lipid-A-disaccharide synthase-like uncharacterized protein